MHRLVSLSPFNNNNKIYMKFAGVDVILILEGKEIDNVKVSDSNL